MFLRLIIVVLLLLPSSLLARERLVVFAASSQTDAMGEIGKAFEAECDCDVVFSYAASSVLSRQINAGANADVFISASPDWIDWLAAQDAIKSRAAFISNRLVLISGKEIVSPAETLHAGRFAMADPRSVPAGVYAKEALSSLGIWTAVQRNAVFTENVRIALKLVVRGDLEAGIVYQSDVQQLPDEADIFKYTFYEESHSEIAYVAGRLNENPDGEAFMQFLKSDTAQSIFEQLGFLPLSDTKSE